MRVVTQYPLGYLEVDIHAPENKIWKGKYELDVPVLHAYRRIAEGRPKGTDEFEDAEKLFWDDVDWQENWKEDGANKVWSKEVLRYAEMNKQKIKFNNAVDLRTWIYPQKAMQNGDA